MQIDRHHFHTIDSTNTWAKHNATLFDRTKVTLVTAETQTGGRGRFNRRWISPAGLNIYATFAVFMEKHRPDIGNLPQVMALAAVKALEAQGFKPKLKWPNDILLSGKKVAGILCETTPLSDTLCVVAGIGLNVNMPVEILEQIDRPATSLLAEDGKQRRVKDMLQLLENHFMELLALFLEESFHPFLEDYKRYLVHHQGDVIRFHDNRVIWEGVFDCITPDGALTLLVDGKPKIFRAGEIV